MRGIFITFEGCDGSGKSTQMKRLHTRLLQLGIDVVLTREPGGTPTGELIRDLLLDPNGPDRTALTETFLYAASRAELAKRILQPALEDGKVVLLERYVDSTLVYQGMAGGIPIRDIEHINRIATYGLIPDLTLVFDIVDPHVLHQRMAPKKKDRIESRDEAYHARVREGYRVLSERYPERIRLIDGELPQNEVEEIVFREVWSILERREGGKMS
ncbi:MAG: dTMP kinase [Bacillota bacterium]|jgi:dTMP kinase